MKKGKTTLVLFLGLLVVAASVTVSRGAVLGETGLNPSHVASDSGFEAQQSTLFRGQDDGNCAIDGDCGDNACREACGSCCSVSGLRVFGDFLYLRPRNAEVVYAVPFDGPVVPPPAVPVQVGRIATVDPDYEPAFRVGIERCLSECSSIGVTYTQLDTSTSDSISVDAPRVLRSMVIHPSTLDAAEDWLDAAASHDINYKLIDLDYRRLWLCGPRHRVSYVAGARYGRLEQSFRSTFASLGTESIDTDVDFDGAGIRVGLEGERQAACSGFLVYGRAAASFMAGEFRGRYTQGSNSDPEIVDASWKAGRLVPTLDLELGVGWASCNGCLRMTAGYMVSAWYNTVRTSDFIGAVQANDFGGLHDTLTFDGFVVRSELRY
jgi:hypothetical protein